MSGSGRNDINVTPLIDVLLVLLVIFLVATPLMMKLEPIQIPRELTSIEYTTDVPLTLSVAADLSVTLDDGVAPPRTLTLAEVARTLRPRFSDSTAAKAVFVEFADAVAWGDVVMTIDSLRGLATDANREDIQVALKMPTEDHHAD